MTQHLEELLETLVRPARGNTAVTWNWSAMKTASCA